MKRDQDEKDVIRPYTVDGIQEYDNPMPRWWLGLLYATIAFAAVYLVAYHILPGKSLEAAYKETLAQQPTGPAGPNGPASGGTAPQNAAGGGTIDEQVKVADNIAAGKAVYAANCFPCHGQNGEGTIGPNLTDDYWLHGGKPSDILRTISQGVPDKGMVAWLPILGDTRVMQVTAYVVSLHGTNPPNAKAPQGELYKP